MRDGWKGDRPWVRLERTGEPVRSPKNTSVIRDGNAS